MLVDVTELRAHLFLGPEPRKGGILEPDLAESRSGVFSPISSILCVHEHAKDHRCNYLYLVTRRKNRHARVWVEDGYYTHPPTHQEILKEEETKCYALTSAPLYLDLKLNENWV